MINVVFLLLIFFLMAAQIAPPEPFDATLPEAEPETPDEAPSALYIAADGAMAFGDLTGEAALDAAIAAGPLTLRADARADASIVAEILTRLSANGAQSLTLVTGEP
jgi:biopolymer transport protein ExbD